ncbi:MAG: DUF1259 domain-containing protein [Gemmatimonas sp.]|nr:DUF1259 domain-containing protein [Gemmatimonas sp.]
MLLVVFALVISAACERPESAEATAEVAVTPVDQEVDWAAVDVAMGRSGTLQDGGVYRFGMPRTDLSVTSEGVQIRTSLALGSWVGMVPAGANEVVAMGDVVLTDDELNPVLARLQEGGVGQAAIHKHLLEHSPEVWWTHVRARGNAVELAETFRAALELTGTPAEGAAEGETAPELTIDTAQISEILGHDGRDNSGVYSIGVPRTETIRSMGIEVPPSMGISTALNFQPTGEGTAAVNGDFAMIADEVDRVVAALRQNEIEVASIHNHLTDEEPRLLFLHFWAEGDAVELARGLRAALDETNSQPGSR